MIFRILDFKGSVPRLTPRLLPDNFAQIARNVRLEDGAISQVRLPAIVHTFASAVQSFYKFGATWAGWPSIVHAAPAPIASDRIYFTGDGVPKMRDAGIDYDLAIPAPAAAATLANLSTPNASLLETVFYVYTFVSAFGEEGPPSPLSVALDTSDGVIVRVNGFSAPPAGRNITLRRIYRSATSASGVTGLFFVAEIPVATASFDHSLATNPIGELIPSTDYDTPPAGMTGLIAMPNGMMAAFDGKELLFCEPYQPHAWPSKYRLAVDVDIIGLAAFGSNVVVLTTGNPYVAQGTHPDSMAMEKVDKYMPCLSAGGIVDTGYAAYFPSSDGLAMISGSDAQIVTRGLFTREQWLALSPATMVAEQFDGRYVFTHTYNTFDSYDAGTATVIPPDNLDGGTSAPTLPSIPDYDFGGAGSAFGLQRVGVIDTSGSQPYFIDSDIALPTAMHANPGDGALYMVQGGTSVMSWDDRAMPPATAVWRSKLVVLPFPTNFGAVLIQTDDPVVTDDIMECRIYADGALVKTITEANKPKKLPSGFQAKQWEIEFLTNVKITGVAIAHNAEELVQL